MSGNVRGFLWWIAIGLTAAISVALLYSASTQWDKGAVGVDPGEVRAAPYPSLARQGYNLVRQSFDETRQLVGKIPGLAFIAPPALPDIFGEHGRRIYASYPVAGSEGGGGGAGNPLDYYRLFHGSYRFPKKVYKDVSQSFTVELSQREPMAAARGQAPKVESQPNSSGGQIAVELVSARDFDRLQIVLSGAGVEPDRATQVQPLTAGVLSFRWYCRFKETGVYTATATVSGIQPDGKTLEFGHFDHQLHVVRVDDMDDGRVWQAGLFFGAITFILGTWKAVKDLWGRKKAPQHKHAQQP